MPINFSLAPFAKVSDVFCETGTFHGDGIISAIDAGFKKIASVEISKVIQDIAKNRVSEVLQSKSADIDFILGDSEEKIVSLIQFAKKNNSQNPVFWLDAHTHHFEDGTVTDGKACPLLSEITAINNAFSGEAILLIDDLRIIDAMATPPHGKLNRLRAASNALMNPDALVSMFKPGWGKSVNLLTVMRLASDPMKVSYKLLDGIEPMDVLCVYPGGLHEALFGQSS